MSEPQSRLRAAARVLLPLAALAGFLFGMWRCAPWSPRAMEAKGCVRIGTAAGVPVYRCPGDAP